MSGIENIWREIFWTPRNFHFCNAYTEQRINQNHWAEPQLCEVCPSKHGLSSYWFVHTCVFVLDLFCVCLFFNLLLVGVVVCFPDIRILHTEIFFLKEESRPVCCRKEQENYFPLTAHQLDSRSKEKFHSQHRTFCNNHGKHSSGAPLQL